MHAAGFYFFFSSITDNMNLIVYATNLHANKTNVQETAKLPAKEL
jgi:hypothetical protein